MSQSQATASPGAFGASELEITDVDHDGIGDVLGLSQTSIVVRHGDPAGRLAAEQSILTTSQTGPAAFGDLDGDGTLDVPEKRPYTRVRIEDVLDGTSKTISVGEAAYLLVVRGV